MFRGKRTRLAVVFLVLVIMHFGFRPLLGDERLAPDFLLLGVLTYAIGARPGNGAIAGFVVGLINDGLVPTAFGAGAFSYTVVGYMAAWSKAVFFADNMYVNAALFFAGAWARDLLVILIGRQWSEAAGASQMLWNLGYRAPMQALTTAIAGVVVLVVFRRWLHVRIGE